MIEPNKPIFIHSIKEAIKEGYLVAVIINGESYDYTPYKEDRTNEENAKLMCDCIRVFAEHPEKLADFESYLSYHFASWFDRWCNCPDGLVNEFNHFANIDELPFC